MTTYYVDSSASGLNNGSSLANAWQEFNDIDSSGFVAGDIIEIYPGNGYAETLTISGVDGASGNPVTYRAMGEIFHSTGRTVLLPESNQSTSYTDDGNGNDNGIYISNSTYIVIDGQQIVTGKQNSPAR